MNRTLIRARANNRGSVSGRDLVNISRRSGRVTYSGS